jgi:uncharacterized protein YoxC
MNLERREEQQENNVLSEECNQNLEKMESLVENLNQILEKLDFMCATVDRINERLKTIQQHLDDMLENNRRMRASIAMATADNLVTHLRYLRLKYNDLLKPPEDIECNAASEGKNE